MDKVINYKDNELELSGWAEETINDFGNILTALYSQSETLKRPDAMIISLVHLNNSLKMQNGTFYGSTNISTHNTHITMNFDVQSYELLNPPKYISAYYEL